jgi:uncharacterized membrane protein YkvA (DUF1232 family)
MNTPDTGLDIGSKRILTALLVQYREEQITGWKGTFAKSVLWYNQSPVALIPDFLPGVGYLDRYLLAQLSLWICGVNPDQVQRKDLLMFDNDCQKLFREGIPKSPIIEKTTVPE